MEGGGDLVLGVENLHLQYILSEEICHISIFFGGFPLPISKRIIMPQ